MELTTLEIILIFLFYSIHAFFSIVSFHTLKVSFIIYYMYFTFSSRRAILKPSKENRNKTERARFPDNRKQLEGGIIMKKMLEKLDELLEEYYASFSVGLDK